MRYFVWGWAMSLYYWFIISAFIRGQWKAFWWPMQMWPMIWSPSNAIDFSGDSRHRQSHQNNEIQLYIDALPREPTQIAAPQFTPKCARSIIIESRHRLYYCRHPVQYVRHAVAHCKRWEIRDAVMRHLFCVNFPWDTCRRCTLSLSSARLTQFLIVHAWSHAFPLFPYTLFQLQLSVVFSQSPTLLTNPTDFRIYLCLSENICTCSITHRISISWPERMLSDTIVRINKKKKPFQCIAFPNRLPLFYTILICNTRESRCQK